MRRFTKKILVFLLAFVITIPAVTVGVSAASMVSVTGADEVAGGDIFTVTVTFDGESIGRVIGDITYDTEILTYISGGSSSGNVGYVELKKAGTGEPCRRYWRCGVLKGCARGHRCGPRLCRPL